MRRQVSSLMLNGKSHGQRWELRDRVGKKRSFRSRVTMRWGGLGKSVVKRNSRRGRGPGGPQKLQGVPARPL